jgi:tetratricopeptide (TPR) repeat protein
MADDTGEPETIRARTLEAIGAFEAAWNAAALEALKRAPKKAPARPKKGQEKKAPEADPRPTDTYLIGELHRQVGDRDEAIAWLEKARASLGTKQEYLKERIAAQLFLARNADAKVEQVVAEARKGSDPEKLLAVDLVRSKGVPSGVGAHALDVIAACEKNHIAADFYLKTLHHHGYPSFKLNHDSVWCTNPKDTIELMKGVQKPWISFKVMAAGAIPPRDAFQYAFAGGADFSLAGMFDFEIEEDVRIAREVLSGLRERPRPWRG